MLLFGRGENGLGKSRQSIFKDAVAKKWTVIDSKMKLAAPGYFGQDSPYSFSYFAGKSRWQRDDPYGMKLFTAATFGMIDFESGVEGDEDLVIGKSGNGSEYVDKAKDVILIWRAALDGDLDGVFREFKEKRSPFSQRGYRRRMMKIGCALGVEEMIKTWIAGVPAEDVAA